MPLWAWLVVVVASAFAVDRLLLAAEARGWIYWRRRKADPQTFATSMLTFQALFEPDRAHMVEEQQRQDADRDQADDEGT